MTGYVSLPMARRLQEAGVKMETNKCWTTYGDKWIIADSDFPFDQIIPAPSMAELWEWLPEGTCLYKELTMSEVWIRDDDRTSRTDTNPADALGELAIWMAERKMK